MNIQDTVNNFQGFIKIWQSNPVTGEQKLLIDKPNTVLYQGADLLAYALAGVANNKISHMYIGFNNNLVFTPPVIDKAYSNPFSGFVAPFGYLRIPLTLPASYLADTNYTHNVPIFTTMITSGTSEAGGATFTNGTSQIYEVGLVAATTPSSSSGDAVFSRANFSQIQYDSSFNLTISWGVKFTAN